MNEQIRQYLEWKRTYIMERSVVMYSYWIASFGRVAKKPVERCGIHDISLFTDYLREKYAPKTAELAMAILHDYFAFWDRRKDLKIRPDDIRVPHGVVAHPRETVTPEEYVTMLTWIGGKTILGLRDNCLIRLLYDTGARISEICSLAAADLDLNERRARIVNRKRRDYGFIYWGEDTNEFLRVYIEQGPEHLFPTTRHALRIVQRYADLAKLGKHIVCHSFRHSKAHLILDNGGTVKDVQFILRHKSPLSSFKYLELSEGEQAARAGLFLKGGQKGAMLPVCQ